LKAYINSIADHLNCNSADVYLYWKGRIALFAALKAAGIGAEDEVIIPGLTCVVVPNAILYCNAKPVYADVRSDTLTIDVNSVTRLINKKTKAILIQNTFGLSVDVDSLVQLGRLNKILTIEDCTHGFGGYFKGKKNGLLADASFFSTQWNKPYSTGLGGILLINRPELFPELNSVNISLIDPEVRDLISLFLSIYAHHFLLTDISYWHLLKFYRLMANLGLVTGSSSVAEIESSIMPDGFFKRCSRLQAQIGLKSLSKLDHVIAMRKKAALAYRRLLAIHHKWHVPAGYDADNSFLKFPVLVHDRRAFLNAAEKEKIRLTDWFVSPIHPVERDFSNWCLNVADIPRAHSISQKLITVNTDVRDVERVCTFLRDNIDLIE